jgi:outer membrane murein-binding lipoprotein Lpp
MSTRQLRGPRSNTDVSMTGAVDFPRPQTWDEIIDHVDMPGPAPIHIEECPEWLSGMIERLKINEGDIRSLVQILNKEGNQIKGDINQVKSHYQKLVDSMQQAYEILRKQGDISQEWTERTIVQIIGQSHDFGKQVWDMIANAETEAAQREFARDEANKRAEERNKAVEAYDCHRHT